MVVTGAAWEEYDSSGYDFCSVPDSGSSALVCAGGVPTDYLNSIVSAVPFRFVENGVTTTRFMDGVVESSPKPNSLAVRFPDGDLVTRSIASWQKYLEGGQRVRGGQTVPASFVKAAVPPPGAALLAAQPAHAAQPAPPPDLRAAGSAVLESIAAASEASQRATIAAQHALALAGSAIERMMLAWPHESQPPAALITEVFGSLPTCTLAFPSSDGSLQVVKVLLDSGANASVMPENLQSVNFGTDTFSTFLPHFEQAWSPASHSVKGVGAAVATGSLTGLSAAFVGHPFAPLAGPFLTLKSDLPFMVLGTEALAGFGITMKFEPGRQLITSTLSDGYTRSVLVQTGALAFPVLFPVVAVADIQPSAGPLPFEGLVIDDLDPDVMPVAMADGHLVLLPSTALVAALTLPVA
jgi:hypothetical protein